MDLSFAHDSKTLDETEISDKSSLLVEQEDIIDILAKKSAPSTVSHTTTPMNKPQMKQTGSSIMAVSISTNNLDEGKIAAYLARFKYHLENPISLIL